MGIWGERGFLPILPSPPPSSDGGSGPHGTASVAPAGGVGAAAARWLGLRPRVAMMVVLWYVFSILSNNSSKVILNAAPYPVTLSYAQFAVNVLFGVAWMDGLGMQPREPWAWATLRPFVPLGIGTSAGMIFAHLAVLWLPVSFAHTVKATSPIWTVLASRAVLGDRPSPRVLLSLLPLVAGVALCGATEMEFNLVGAAAALASTLIFVAQNIHVKRAGLGRLRIDLLNQLVLISLLALATLLPVWLVVEGGDIWRAPPRLAALPGLLLLYLFNGLMHFGQTVAAYSVLCDPSVSSTTYSVANTFKRAFVIAVSILFFRNSVSLLNALGILLSVAGVLLYNHLNALEPLPPAALLPIHIPTQSEAPSPVSVSLRAPRIGRSASSDADADAFVPMVTSASVVSFVRV